MSKKRRKQKKQKKQRKQRKRQAKLSSHDVVEKQKRWIAENQLPLASAGWNFYVEKGRGLIVVREAVSITQTSGDSLSAMDLEYLPQAGIPSEPEYEAERRICAAYIPEKEIAVLFRGPEKDGHPEILDCLRLQPTIPPSEAAEKVQQSAGRKSGMPTSEGALSIPAIVVSSGEEKTGTVNVELRTEMSEQDLLRIMRERYPVILGSSPLDDPDLEMQRGLPLTAVIRGWDDDSRELYNIPEVISLARRMMKVGFISLMAPGPLLPAFSPPFNYIPGTWGAYEIWGCSEEFLGGALETYRGEEFARVLEESNRICDINCGGGV